MMPHDAIPPSALPLRATLPAMRETTRAALVAWGMAQPARPRAWLAARAWDMTPESSLDARPYEATAALDLLKWRTQTSSDKCAVGQLSEWEKNSLATRDK